jgi:uncharacterized membrane protein HdeD (DUF308 family)
MGTKSMATLAFLSGVMGVLVGIVALTSSPAPGSALVPVSLAFTAICLLSGTAASTFRQHAAKIAELERRLSKAEGAQ